jgi:O-antigen/teichoic acid export membrane protein
MLAGAVLALGPISQLLIARINGYERMGLAAAADATASLVLLGSVMALLAWGAGPLALIAAWGMRELTLCGAAWLLGRRHLPPPPEPRRTAPAARETLRATLPFALMVFLHFLYLRLGLLLVRHLAPMERDLGHYAAAARLVDGLLLLAGLVGTALYPRLASLHRSDAAGLRHTLSGVHRWLGLMGIPIAVLLAAWGPWLAPRLFGGGYQPSARILALLAVPVLLNYLYWPSAHALNATGCERLWLRALTTMLVLQAGVGLWLVPRLAGAGAAVATGLGEAAALAVVFAYVRRAVPGFRPLRALAPLAPPALVLAACVLFVGRWQLVAGSALGLLAYAWMLRSDLRQMHQSLRAVVLRHA